MEQKRNIIGNQSLSQGQPRVLKGATRTEDDIGFASKIDRQSRKLASASWSPSSFSMLSQVLTKTGIAHHMKLHRSPPWDIVTISSPSASSALLKLLSTSYWPQVGIVACLFVSIDIQFISIINLRLMVEGRCVFPLKGIVIPLSRD